MAFTVEDGTFVAGANAYETVVEFKAYHDERGVDYATVLTSDTLIEQAIVKATDYVEHRWAGRFLGCIEDQDQNLSFPRLYIRGPNGRLLTGVPTLLKDAISIYALAAGSGSLFATPELDATGQTIKRLREKVGPIETETEYHEGGLVSELVPNPAADRLIAHLTLSTSGVIRA